MNRHGRKGLGFYASLELWSAVLAASAARSPAEAQPVSAASDSAGSCAVSMALPWLAGGKTYHVVAIASGSNCLSANVTLTIKDPAGNTLLTFTSAAADLPSQFREVATRQAMAVALRHWVDQRGDERSTRDLPAWDADKEQPLPGAGTQFQPEPLISRQNFMDRRRWGQPMFCFLQGPNHEACYAIDTKTDSLTLLGTITVSG